MNVPLPGQAPSRSRSRLDGRSGLRLKRGLTVLLAPLIFLCLVEIVLRLVGFGYPTSYFIPSPADSQRLVENPSFGRRFFPPGLLRVPPPTTFLRHKTPGTIRVFVIGESAAMGDPKPAYGVARYLEVLLRERYPGTKFEVIAVAMTAINSHALVAMARECAGLEADFWVVFAGNNEMLGPFGAGSVLGSHAPPWRLVRLMLAARATRVGQAIEALAAIIRDRPVGSSQWAGVRVLAQDTVEGDAPERHRVYEAFRRNLQDLVAAGQRGGAQVLLSTVAVNLRDSAPFGSAHREGLAPDLLTEWNQAIEECRRSFTNDAPIPPAAIGKALAIDGRFAEAQFLLGHSHLQFPSNSVAASKAFALARDLDTVPLRTDSEENQIIHQVAAGRSAPLIDAEDALARQSMGGAPGIEFFYEHVHLTPEGNYALARAFAEALAPLLPESSRVTSQRDWATPEVCATRLVLTPWARAAAAEAILARCLDAPFTNRFNNEAQVEALAGMVARERRAETQAAASDVRGLYTNAIAAAPDDHHFHRGFAEFLNATRDLTGAAAEWRKVRELLPNHPVAYLEEGSLLRRLGRVDEARPLIEQAVRMQPDWVDAHLELGDLLLARGRPVEAVAAMRAAIHLQPGNARAHLRLADALAADRQKDAAMESLKEAIRLNPRLWEARYFLGVEYALRGEIEAAREEFSEVVRLKPDHPRAQFNLGIALARQSKWPQAVEHLTEAVRLDPRNQEAKQALAQIAAIREGNGSQAPAP